MSPRGTTDTMAQGLFLLVVAVVAASPAGGVLACSAFAVGGDGLVLFAGNEDFWDPDTKMWIVPASEEGTHGRLYFGYSDLLPQGGMNEAGLAYDGFATSPKPVRGGAGKPVLSERELIDAAMATCATVDEVVAFFNRYNLEVMSSFMLMFADRTGASVIIEGDEILRKSGTFQVITNFRQSEHPTGKGAYEGGESCTRFEIASERLGQLKQVTVDAARDVLAAIHAEGRSRTLYSVIYDLGRRRALLYHFHDFSRAVAVDLADELERGARVIDLPSLFPRSYAYEAYAREQAAELERRRVERGPVALSPELISRYVGSYGGPEGTVDVSLREGRLVADGVGLPRVPLTAASETAFFAVRFIGDVELEFRLGEGGEVVGADLRVGTQSAFAERIH